MKQQSMEWKHHGSPKPTGFRVQRYAGKVVGSVFWNTCRVIIIYYLEKCQTITGDYYAAFLTLKGRETNIPQS